MLQSEGMGSLQPLGFGSRPKLRR